MSPEREPMENDSNSRTAEELDVALQKNKKQIENRTEK